MLMVLSGMSNMEQMQDNISFMRDFRPLNEAEMAAVERVQEIFHSKHLIPCTSCRDCTDGCPQHISIPDLFAIMNTKHTHHDWNADCYYEDVHTAPGRKASDCLKCGKCEKACRAGAIRFEDLPDGQTRAVITPWKCSECGVCVATCSNGGLDGLKLRQLTTLGPVSVYKCTKSLCKECGKPIAPTCKDGICSVCRIKIRTKKRQEEAVAKAKERQAEREAKRAAEEAAKALAAEVQAESAAAAAETAPAAAVPEAPAAETKMN